MGGGQPWLPPDGAAEILYAPDGAGALLEGDGLRLVGWGELGCARRVRAHRRAISAHESPGCQLRLIRRPLVFSNIPVHPGSILNSGSP